MSTASTLLSPLFLCTAPSDFTPGPYTTVFLRKQTRADIQILISDDGVFEGPETFTVNLTLRSIDTRRATTVDPSQAEVTIFDGNGMCDRDTCGAMDSCSSWVGKVVPRLTVLIDF